MRKQLRFDCYDYIATAMGNRTPSLVLSYYCYGYVDTSGGKSLLGATVSESDTLVVRVNHHDGKSVNVNDTITVDGKKYQVNAIKRERFHTIFTCRGDKRD